jgi:hypothetical protein
MPDVIYYAEEGFVIMNIIKSGDSMYIALRSIDSTNDDKIVRIKVAD